MKLDAVQLALLNLSYEIRESIKRAKARDDWDEVARLQGQVFSLRLAMRALDHRTFKRLTSFGTKE